MINNDVSIYDIETWTGGRRPNPEIDELRCLGAYSYKYNKYYFLTEHEKMKKFLADHQVLVSFNGKNYDDIILKRYGIFPEYKYIVDLWESCKKRKTILKIENESLSLSNLAKVFGLEEKKLDTFDYNILKTKPQQWDKETKSYILDYTIQDIRTTKKLFEYLMKLFESFREFMSEKDQMSYKWISTSAGSYAYKVLCHRAGLEETYNDAEDIERKSYPGGYVSLPTSAEVHGKIYCLDFNSAYPHAFMMANLYTPGTGFTGNDMFPVRGSYSTEEQGQIEREIGDLYDKRVILKKQKDPAQFAIKTIINTLYGISGSPVFAQTYDYNRACDCTLICRNMIKHARKLFKDSGYEVVYTDTDSCYVKDIFDDEVRLLNVRDRIISDIKANLPFPRDTFDMGIDERIKHMYFFKNKQGDFLKKHYIYVTEDDEVVIKGVPAIKNDSSGLGLSFINEVISPMLKQGKLNVTRQDVSEWLSKKITDDISCVARRFRVHSSYKSDTCIQAQISKEYGAGTHLLIPNNLYGVGKSIHYCTYEEFKEKGLTIDNLVLTKFWEELRGFIER